MADSQRSDTTAAELLWDPLALAGSTSRRSAAAPAFSPRAGEMFSDDPRAAAIALPTRPLHLMYAEPAREISRATAAWCAPARLRRSSCPPMVAPLPAFASARRLSRPVRSFERAVVRAGRSVRRAPAALSDVSIARAAWLVPIVTVNLWFDRRVLDLPLVGLPGRTMQWVFDKRIVFGGEASHLSLVSSGAADILAETNIELVHRAHEELLDALPDVRAARLVQATVIREPRATFSLAPGQPARPSTQTDVQGFLLAGDWTATGCRRPSKERTVGEPGGRPLHW